MLRCTGVEDIALRDCFIRVRMSACIRRMAMSESREGRSHPKTCVEHNATARVTGEWRPHHWICNEAGLFEVKSSTRPTSRPSSRSPQYTRPSFLDLELVVNSMCCLRPSPRGSFSGVDPDENPASLRRLVETSKVPSKDDCSIRLAGPFDVVPAISRIGEEEWGESESWRKVRFSSALVVVARMVYLGVPDVDNNETVPVKELDNMVTTVQNDEQSGNSPTARGSVYGSFLPGGGVVLQQDVRCYMGIRRRQTKRRVGNERPINVGIRSLDIYACGLHGLDAIGQCSIGRFWLKAGLPRQRPACLTHECRGRGRSQTRPRSEA